MPLIPTPRSDAEREWDEAKDKRNAAEAEWREALRVLELERARARVKIALDKPGAAKWVIVDQLTILEATEGSALQRAALGATAKQALFDSLASHCETLKQVVWRVSR